MNSQMAYCDELNVSFQTLLTDSDDDNELTDEILDDSTPSVLPAIERDDDSDESNVSDYNDDEGDGWTDDVAKQDRRIFDDDDCALNLHLLVSCIDPVDYYELFMHDIRNLIVREINGQGQEKDPSWQPTDVPETKTTA